MSVNVINHDAHNNMCYLVKKIIVENNNILCISAATIFSLTNSDIDDKQDLVSIQLVPIINSILGSETFWDTGLPKGVAEFLVSGSAYSLEPVIKSDVSVSVGNLYKQLNVFGDRKWTETGISEPEPFTTIAIDYKNAFGGKGYEQNPFGKGFISDGFTDMPLPNIELPQQQITSKNDKPEVAGFEPYPLNWPQRNFSTTFDINSSIVNLADGVMPIHFNCAPSDQRLSGFFNGDEKIEIKNMHSRLPVISTQLPGIRFRAFAVQENTDKEDVFLEMVTQADTLWLLPNMECGILLFRATCPISTIEADDIKIIYSVVENLKEPPRPIQYYLQHVVSKGETVEGDQIKTHGVLSGDNILSETTNTNTGIKQQLNLDSDKQSEKAKYKNTDQAQETSDQIVDEEEMILDLIRNAQSGVVPDIPGVNSQFKDILGKVNEMIAQFKLTESEVQEYMEERKKSGLSAYPSEDEIIENFREVWEKDPKMEVSLREKMQALKTIRSDMLDRIHMHNKNNL